MRDVPPGLIPEEVQRKNEIHNWRNAVQVLAGSYPAEWEDILEVLGSFYPNATQTAIVFRRT
jgi:hypothetical protein